MERGLEKEPLPERVKNRPITDGHCLSIRERLILKRIEIELRRDRRLVGALAKGPDSRSPRRQPLLPTAVLFFGITSVFLMVVGMRTSDPGVLWTFAGVWPLTLLLAFRLLCRWSKPRACR
ncbi:DUF3040 domain-containing protein [Streptomyces sp. NPDC008343]|uniref:DUF3040 domain-containing protein n=1 Tax=Streptomyces sp. NPDC008343 TaxID=3364828 RepID=UPI0036E16810